ncbi:MAG: 30S ribosomal protein S21 [Candidatus Aminicenantes bacterium]|nr:30S ribosomal protein S21 [Candidatus Aminicenantes bacterium]
MVQVKKKERETSESLIRRFSRRVQQSGVLLTARRSRFYAKPKSRRQVRESAQYRAKVKKEVDKLKKIGKFDEEALRRVKKKIIDQ